MNRLVVAELLAKETQYNGQCHKSRAHENDFHAEVHKWLLAFLKNAERRVPKLCNRTKNCHNHSEKQDRGSLGERQHARYVCKTGQIQLLE